MTYNNAAPGSFEDIELTDIWVGWIRWTNICLIMDSQEEHSSGGEKHSSPC